MEIDLPREIPAMTLPNTVLFPQSLLPLHIFEPRYRKMLGDVLRADRIFAIARLARRSVPASDQPEPLHRIATAGVVRACQKNENGTSDLLLQGLCRVEVLRIVREKPYRFVEIRPLLPVTDATAGELQALRAQAIRLLDLQRKLGLPLSGEMAQVVKGVTDPEVFANLASFAFGEDADFKQLLLETLGTGRRLALIGGKLERDLAFARLQRRLQGNLTDDDIAHN